MRRRTVSSSHSGRPCPECGAIAPNPHRAWCRESGDWLPEKPFPAGPALTPVTPVVPCRCPGQVVTGQTTLIGGRFAALPLAVDVLLSLAGDPAPTMPPHRVPAVAGLPQLPAIMVPPTIQLVWPDCDVPFGLTAEWWSALGAWCRGRRVGIGCMGGHGRTGTAMSILLSYLASITGPAAVARVRAEYCPRAVESEAQEEYVRIMGWRK